MFNPLVMLKTILIFLLAFYVHIAVAQKGMLMGKIVDEQNNPVRNARLIVARDAVDYTAVVTSEGLYYTDSMIQGDYKVYIIVGKVTYESTTKVQPTYRKHYFYNFRLLGTKAFVSAVDSDPFMERALIKAQKAPAVFNY